MGIEQVGISAAMTTPLHIVGNHSQHIPNNAEGMVAILHARPEIDFPPQTPARGHVAALLQRIGSSGEQIGMSVGRYLVGGIEAIEMRDVTMLVLGIITVPQPLLQLTIASNLHRW